MHSLRTMSNSKKKWRAFAHPDAGFQYTGAALETNWARLHRCDGEPYPSAASLAERQAGANARSAAAVVTSVQDAWRAYHCGDFRRAFELGSQAGLPGFAAATKAACVYASYLETDAARARTLLLQATHLAQDAAAQLPQDANAHYLLAFALGRYSQRTSVLQALASGHAATIEHSLQQALKIQPRHCEAHIATGLYHAELIGKVGALVAGLSHGASRAQAIAHFKQAVKLGPGLPAPSLEYANGLRLMGDNGGAEIEKLLRHAAHCEPLDAAGWLDVEAAQRQLQ